MADGSAHGGKILGEGLTFDDVLLVPGHSLVHPSETNVESSLTNAIPLQIPLLSAAMDTVTESRMAIALAREGGLGIVHKNMSVERQVREVEKVKRSANGIITDPVTLGPDERVATAQQVG